MNINDVRGSSNESGKGIILDNSGHSNSPENNIMTKHVKQNSFDSGIADAAQSFTASSSVSGGLSE